jgi:hypothetical protein
VAVERVVVIPRNGYVNRLQAWASSAALAAEWDAPLSVCWEPESVAPADFEDLFESRSLHQRIGPQAVHALCGKPHEELPQYLTYLPERSVVVLAGHDRGEQVFIPDLAELVTSIAEPLTVVVIAGGIFGTADAGLQRRSRHEFYRSLPWRQSITDRVTDVVGDHDAFLSVHIRHTDRSREAPTASKVATAVKQMQSQTKIGSIFIASDTAAGVSKWTQRLTSMGLQPWSADTDDHARDSIAAGIAALVEWQILGRSRGLVFSATSSFGSEAAVAAGDVPEFGLSASRGLQRLRVLREVLRAGATYPMRHGPLAR